METAFRRLLALAACVLAFLPAAAQAPGDVRIALIVGNAAYPGAAALANPVNDARAMAQVMRRLGFTVIDLHDAGAAQLRAALASMAEQLHGRRAVAMLYYAGHGLQHDWRNFIVPVDARLQAADDIPRATVDVAEFLDAFRAAGNRLNLLVLDACRNNPFDNALATKGLAPVDAPPGTYLAFATAPGNVAEDGEGANGLYTRYLVEELQRPAARLDDVFKRVRARVQQASGGRQVPAASTNLDEDFRFDGGFSRPDREPAARLERFETERRDWEQVRNSVSAGDFFAFLQRWPNGFMSEIAQFRADQLQRPAVVAQQRRDGILALASGTNRFRTGDEFTFVTTDRLTGMVRREPQRVTFADDRRVELNDGATVYDQLGGVLRDDTGDKNPAVQMVPADIALGKEWRSVFRNRVGGFNVTIVADFRVVALEDVDLEGEVVRAFRAELDARGRGATVRGTLWIEPRTMRLVRWDREGRAGGRILDRSTLLVTQYRPVPR